MYARFSLGILLSAAPLAPCAALEPLPVQKQDSVKLPDIQVKGVVPVSPEDATALKLPATLQETPRSVTIVDAQAIEQRNLRTVSDVFESAPGFFANSRTNEGYHFLARGFRMGPADTKVDGFSGLIAGGGQKAFTLYGIDSVTLLGGPANLNYGQANLPGGMVNLVTKKAQLGLPSTFSITTQAYAGQGVSIHERQGLGVELDHNDVVAGAPFRVGYGADNTHGFVADTLDRNRYGGASAVVRFGPADSLTLTPLVHRWESVTPAGAGMVASPSSSLTTNDGSSLLHVDDISPLDINLHGGGRTDHVTLAGFDFQASSDPSLKLNLGYRFIHFDTDRNEWSPKALTAGGILTRQQTKSQSASDGHNLDASISLASNITATIRNRFVAGIRLAVIEARSRSANGALTAAQAPINVYTGVLTGAGLADVSTSWKPYTLTESTQWSAYLQDQASLLDGRLVITGGLGYGQFSKKGYGTFNSSVTPNLAVMWNLRQDLGFYASYDQSYQYPDPAIAYEDVLGNPLNPGPTTGDSREVGCKYLFPDRRGNITIALFSARRQNVYQQSATTALNANGNRYYTSIPGQEAHGVELSSHYRVTSGWSLDASAAWIRGSYDDTALGDTLARTPEHSLNLTSRWEHGRAFGAGMLTSYAGLAWQAERLSGTGARTPAAPDPIVLPAFARFDVGAECTVNDKLRLALHVRNLLDRRIFIDGTTGANLQLDAPRTITLRATYSY